MEYKYAVGPAGSRFLAGLRDNKKIMGVRCPNCNRVYVPPRSICRECFSKLEEWVELPGEGTLNSCTVVHYSEPFHPAETPVIYGIIQLEGADTALPHLLGEVEPGSLRIGMGVEPVFREKREGNILNCHCDPDLSGEVIHYSFQRLLRHCVPRKALAQKLNKGVKREWLKR